MDKNVQIAFNTKKGSVPARLDVDVSQLDACSQIGVARCRTPSSGSLRRTS
jgi:glucose/mannose transport system substrate-binding protein